MNEIMLEDFRDDQFYYFHQEAYLAKTLLYNGLSDLYLSSFNHASSLGKARQYQAFFNLSISLERLEKLAFIFYELDKNNTLPQGTSIRQKGHDLKKLFNELQNFSSSTHQSFFTSLPQISMDILELLTDFAKRTRYENLDRLSGASSNINKEPVQEFDKILEKIEQDYQNHKFKDRLDKLAERIDLGSSSDFTLKNNNTLMLTILKDNQNKQITYSELKEQTKIRVTSFPLTYFYILQVFRPVIAVLNEWNKSCFDKAQENFLYNQIINSFPNISEKHLLYDGIKKFVSNGSNSQQNSKLDVPEIFEIFKKNKFIEIDDVSIILDFLEEENQIYNWFVIVDD